jgi:uncharacterized membrane protein YesL
MKNRSIITYTPSLLSYNREKYFTAQPLSSITVPMPVTKICIMIYFLFVLPFTSFFHSSTNVQLVCSYIFTALHPHYTQIMNNSQAN